MLTRPSMALSATILSSISLLYSPYLLAQQPTQDDINQLKQQIAELQRQLQQLEQRIQQAAVRLALVLEHSFNPEATGG